MADPVLPNLASTAGTITALAAIVVFFWRKIDTDSRLSANRRDADNCKYAEMLAAETKKCEDNYHELKTEFQAQSTWQRETMIGTIEANTKELTAIRRELRAHDMLPAEAETAAYAIRPTPPPSGHLKLKRK